jgi:hypothetical protein
MTVSAPAPDHGAAEAATPDAPGALSRLVQQVNDSGVSYAQMAQRVSKEKSLEPLGKQYFQKLAKTPPVSAPSPKQMESIAAALRKPLQVVKLAAAEQWLDYTATELSGYSDEVRIIVAHLAGKPPAEVRRWRVLMEADEQVRREGE